MNHILTWDILGKINQITLKGSVLLLLVFAVQQVPMQLPPIKTNSAPSNRVKERMSWRTPKKNTDVGWGGGRKRSLKS